MIDFICRLLGWKRDIVPVFVVLCYREKQMIAIRMILESLTTAEAEAAHMNETMPGLRYEVQVQALVRDL